MAAVFIFQACRIEVLILFAVNNIVCRCLGRLVCCPARRFIPAPRKFPVVMFSTGKTSTRDVSIVVQPRYCLFNQCQP